MSWGISPEGNFTNNVYLPGISELTLPVQQNIIPGQTFNAVDSLGVGSI